MKTKIAMINSLALIGVATAGYLIGKKMGKPKTVYAGTLWVDESEPNGQPGLYLELHTDVENVRNAKVIQLKVMHKK